MPWDRLRFSAPVAVERGPKFRRRRIADDPDLGRNDTTSFFVSGFGSGAYSAKLFAGTKHRLSGFSHPRQCGDAVLRMFHRPGDSCPPGGRPRATSCTIATISPTISPRSLPAAPSSKSRTAARISALPKCRRTVGNAAAQSREETPRRKPGNVVTRLGHLRHAYYGPAYGRFGPAPWSYVPPQPAETVRSCSHGRRTAIFCLNSMQVLRTSAVISVQFSI